MSGTRPMCRAPPARRASSPDRRSCISIASSGTCCPTPTTAAAAMQAGELDWWEAPTFDLLPLLRKADNLTVPAPNPLGLSRRHALQPPAAAVQQSGAAAGAAGRGQPGRLHDRRRRHRPAELAHPVGVFCPQSPMASDAGMDGADRAARPRRGEAGGGRVRLPGREGGRSGALRLSHPAGAGAMSAWTCCRRPGSTWSRATPTGAACCKRLAKTDPVEEGGWSAFHTYWSGLDQFDPAVHVWIRGNGKAAARGWPDSPKLEALRDEWLARRRSGGRRSGSPRTSSVRRSLTCRIFRWARSCRPGRISGP